MREGREIAHPFSNSMFVYLWRLMALSAWSLGGLGGALSSPPLLSLSVITSTFVELAGLRLDFPSADTWPCIWMLF